MVAYLYGSGVTCTFSAFEPGARPWTPTVPDANARCPESGQRVPSAIRTPAGPLKTRLRLRQLSGLFRPVHVWLRHRQTGRKAQIIAARSNDLALFLGWDWPETSRAEPPERSGGFGIKPGKLSEPQASF